MRTVCFWMSVVAVAAITAACNAAPGSPSFSPTAPSPSLGGSGSGSLSPLQLQAAEACGAIQQPDGTITVGTPPSGSPPPYTTTPPPGGGPVTSGPGAPGGPATGAQVVLAGEVANVSGQYPSLTLTFGPQTVRTTAATSFHNVSAASIAPGSRLGAVGITAADQTVTATCVAAL
jgi:Domain of unknown function (DUF5666)